MSFDANADFVSLSLPEGGSVKPKLSKEQRQAKKLKAKIHTKALMKQRTKEAKSRVKARVEVRKEAREEYKRMAKMVDMDKLRQRRDAKMARQQDDSQPPAQGKKSKTRFEVDLLPEMLAEASKHPKYVAPSLSLAELQDNLLTGSEKRAAKRSAAEKQEAHAIKKQEKKARQAMQKTEQAQNEAGFDGPFMIDTTGTTIATK